MTVERILPHNSNRLFVTDGGQETTLIFHEGFDLPEFASFVLLKEEKGREALRRYFREYMKIAREVEAPLILETVTWRSSPDWSSKLGYSPDEMDTANSEAVEMINELRPEYEAGGSPLIISGCVGPRGDGYVAGEMMDAEEAKLYHQRQVSTLRNSGADLITAITMTYEEEAIGIADAAAEAGAPCVISFTVETDGRLPNGSTLAEAILKVDLGAETRPAYYMINCAHPTHFLEALKEGSGWQERILGTRVNASKMSHAELDEAEELDEGDPDELAEYHEEVRNLLPNLRVFGGCCGTDDRHVGAIVRRMFDGARALPA